MNDREADELPGGLVAVPDDLTVEMPVEAAADVIWEAIGRASGLPREFWGPGVAEGLLAGQLRRQEDGRLIGQLTTTPGSGNWVQGNNMGGALGAPLVSFTCAGELKGSIDAKGVYELGPPRTHFIAGKMDLKAKKQG